MYNEPFTMTMTAATNDSKRNNNAMVFTPHGQTTTIKTENIKPVAGGSEKPQIETITPNTASKEPIKSVSNPIKLILTSQLVPYFGLRYEFRLVVTHFHHLS